MHSTCSDYLAELRIIRTAGPLAVHKQTLIVETQQSAFSIQSPSQLAISMAQS